MVLKSVVKRSLLQQYHLIHTQYPRSADIMGSTVATQEYQNVQYECRSIRNGFKSKPDYSNKSCKTRRRILELNQTGDSK